MFVCVVGNKGEDEVQESDTATAVRTAKLSRETRAQRHRAGKRKTGGGDRERKQVNGIF